MTILNVFQIPRCLSDSQKAKEILDEINSNYEKGSSEWVDAMFKETNYQHVIYFNEVNNITDFNNVMVALDYWGSKYSLSLYFYAMFHREEVLVFLQNLYISYFDLSSDYSILPESEQKIYKFLIKVKSKLYLRQVKINDVKQYMKYNRKEVNYLFIKDKKHSAEISRKVNSEPIF